MDEKHTRESLIDPALRVAGWDLDNPSAVTQELAVELAGEIAEGTELPAEADRFTDYALNSGGNPAAVLEAKRSSKDAEIGREQGLKYAQALQRRHGGKIPFVLYTNGGKHFFWDSESYPPERIYGFPTPDDLAWMAERRAQMRPLSVEMIDSEIAGWDFQIEGIRTILEGIEARHRTFLMVMATGTGKTRTATALIDVLRRAKWVQRTLFLVDRIALRDQALEAFAEFIPAEPRWPQKRSGVLETRFERNRRLYVATYPTMKNLIDSGNDARSYISPFFFDLVIADESHRSIYNSYQQVLTYFHALKLGLTATPKDHVDFDTFKLFECPAGRPTFAYSYEEAISHAPPYLCEFDVLDVQSQYQVEGIHGGELPGPIQDQLVRSGRDLEDVDFEGTDLEKRVTNAGTNAVIVREFMEESIKDGDGVVPGKSIFFAVSIRHARRLEEIFDRLFPEYAGKLARVIVSNDPRVYGPGGLLDQFKNTDFPRIAISVDMLDTGVDVREVVNLVFAKPVWSYTKFWQMIGRGTRILDSNPENRKSWCREKGGFLIIDCWKNFENFKLNPRGREPKAQVPLPVKLFRARLAKLEAAGVAGAADIAEQTKTRLREDLRELPKNNVVVMDHRSELSTVEDDVFWERLERSGLEYLRRTIAPIFRARSTGDYRAMAFEKDVVEAQTAVLARNAELLEAMRERIQAAAGELPISVNLVARERPAIERVLSDGFWLGPTDAGLEELVSRLGPLMKLRQKRPDEMKLDILDMTAHKETIEFGPSHERLTTKKYREEIEGTVRSLVESIPALKKIQAGESISSDEVRELASALAQRHPFATEEILRTVYDSPKARFEQFLSHILTGERLPSWSETVSRAFDAFIASHTTLSSLQIRFLQTMRTFILQTRRLEKENLVEAPFTQVHPQGIRGVFRPEQIEEVVALAARLVA